MLVYILANIVNVILQTIRSLATVKCGKVLASLSNALAYGFYTFIIVLTALDGISLVMKCVIVGASNLLGVFIVKLVEERLRKDRLWEIKCTCRTDIAGIIDFELTNNNISHNFYKIDDRHIGFNIYANTQNESLFVKEIIKDYGCKYFASESKIL